MNRKPPAARATRRPASGAAWCVLGTALIAMAHGGSSGIGAEPSASLASRPRQPVALAFSADGARLFVANRRSGSLSVVDLDAARVVAEHDVGRSLADLAPLPDGRHLLAVDQGAGALLLLEDRDGSVRVVGRREVGPDPVTVAVAPDGGSCVVASPGARRLSFVALDRPEGGGAPSLAVTRTLGLPFSPRCMALVRAGAKLIVADAFGGRLAVVDPRRGTLEAVHSLPAHNIRGLAVSPDGQSMVVAHQVLHRLARASFEDVHWGSLLGNDLRVLKLDRVLAPGPDADPLRDGRHFPLGETGRGSGDPAAVAFDREGHFIAALAGVDEVLIGPDPGHLPHRTAVGRRPTALAPSPDGRTVAVANSLDDTLSTIDLATGDRRSTIPLGPRPEWSAVERGERLFFDARLSHDGWMSCHSCHTDGHSNGRNGDTLGDGGFGAPKRVPSLLGVGATGPWGWRGGFERLEDQVRQSIASTMQGPEPAASDVSDLVDFLRTLTPPAPATPPADETSVDRGRAVFRTRGCAECHAPPEFTTPQLYDVGLADEVGQREFNPPSLRGVGRREPLLHDGRAATLEDVFGRHRHPRDAELSAGEAADLVAFLRSL